MLHGCRSQVSNKKANKIISRSSKRGSLNTKANEGRLPASKVHLNLVLCQGTSLLFPLITDNLDFLESKLFMDSSIF